jgi:hypothetical protein
MSAEQEGHRSPPAVILTYRCTICTPQLRKTPSP